MKSKEIAKEDIHYVDNNVRDVMNAFRNTPLELKFVNGRLDSQYIIFKDRKRFKDAIRVSNHKSRGFSKRRNVRYQLVKPCFNSKVTKRINNKHEIYETSNIVSLVTFILYDLHTKEKIDMLEYSYMRNHVEEYFNYKKNKEKEDKENGN